AIDEVAAYEAGRAGDQEPHDILSSTRTLRIHAARFIPQRSESRPILPERQGSAMPDVWLGDAEREWSKRMRSTSRALRKLPEIRSRRESPSSRQRTPTSLML